MFSRKTDSITLILIHSRPVYKANQSIERRIAPDDSHTPRRRDRACPVRMCTKISNFEAEKPPIPQTTGRASLVRSEGEKQITEAVKVLPCQCNSLRRGEI